MNKCVVGVLALGAMLAPVGCTSYRPVSSFKENSIVRVDLEGNNFRVIASGIQASASTPYLLYGPGQIWRAYQQGMASFFRPMAAQQLAATGVLQQTISGIVLGDPALLEKAMADLSEKANMVGKSAFLHNINTEWVTKGYFGIYGIRSVYITADIVEFTDEYLDYKPRL